MTTSPTKKTLALAYSLIATAIVLGIVVMQVKAANKPAEDEDKLLIEFVRAYPDDYMNLDETYLYPGEDYWLQINYNNQYDTVRFSLKREVILNAEITLSVDCETREIQLTGTKGILLDDETTMKHGELEESEEDS